MLVGRVEQVTNWRLISSSQPQTEVKLDIMCNAENHRGSSIDFRWDNTNIISVGGFYFPFATWKTPKVLSAITVCYLDYPFSWFVAGLQPWLHTLQARTSLQKFGKTCFPWLVFLLLWVHPFRQLKIGAPSNRLPLQLRRNHFSCSQQISLQRR